MQKPPECDTCILRNRGNGFSRPEGSGRNGVLGIGESLGHEEFIDGLPFRPHAQAGSALERAFKLTGVDRQDFRLWNLVACQPPANKLEGTDYGAAAIQHCKVHFDRVLNLHRRGCTDNYGHSVNPTFLAFGNLPLKVLTGYSGDAKRKESISNLRGYVLPSSNYPGIFVVGIYHPSYIKRGNSKLYPTLMDDIAKAIAVSNGSLTSYKGGSSYQKPNYKLHPSILEAEAFYQQVKDNVNLLLSMDIETPRSGEVEEDQRDEVEEGEEFHKITQVQFSLRKCEGMALPWNSAYLPIIKRIFACNNLKLGFNWWGFDAERVKAEGVYVEGLPHDLMLMFKHYSPGLPRGLQAVASHCNFPFPWKHLFDTEFEFYGCADVDAPQWIYEWLPGAMKELGVWQGYLDHLYGYYPILLRGSERGIPVDNEARLTLKSTLEGEQATLLKDLEKLIPIETRAVGPRKKNKETGEVTFGYVKASPKLKALYEVYKAKKALLIAKGKKVIDFRAYAALHGFIVRDNKWCKLMPLKTSKEQIVRYIKWKKNQLLNE